MPDTLPQTFGRYCIVEKIGEGGMGSVYLAEDTVMRRKVALKIPKFREDEDPDILERFYREARLAGQITHPNLCPVHDVGCIDGIHYLTMAYIHGTPLDKLVGPGHPWPAPHALKLVRHLASVLILLHGQGIIHRDLKPANVMIHSDGTPVLLDFGLARSFTGSDKPTAPGETMGTPAYMAPEQVNGREELIGARTDVWALGVILYQLLTGKVPFMAPTAMEIWSHILFQELPPPSALWPGLDRRLDELCAQVLSKDPRYRPATMEVFLQMLFTLDAQISGTPLEVTPVSESPLTTPTTDLPTHRPMPIRRESRIPVIFGSLLMGGGVLLVLGSLLVASGLFSAPRPVSAEPSPAEPPTLAKLSPSITLSFPDEIELRTGASQRLTVEVLRRDYNERVDLDQVGRSDGIRLRPVPVEAGQSRVAMAIEADQSAKSGSYVLTIRATGAGVEPVSRSLTVQIRSVLAPMPLEATINNSIGMKLVLIPKGKFWMGSSPEERKKVERELKGTILEKPHQDSLDMEQPQHEVEITQPFYLGAYEVTQEQYERVVQGNPSWFRRGGNGKQQVQGLDTSRLPVEWVSWEEAVEFCRLLSNLPAEKAAKRRYRLPTEAEWEYACRAGGTRALFHYGDKLTPTEANFDKPLGRPVAVDDPRYKANAFGLYHMHGNVWEWCSDLRDAKYYQTCVAEQIGQDPQGPTENKMNCRVVRGGSWQSNGVLCRSALRNCYVPDERTNIVGFRVVCVPVR